MLNIPLRSEHSGLARVPRMRVHPGGDGAADQIRCAVQVPEHSAPRHVPDPEVALS